ncbi:hypothetical protein F9U64_00100 [Gracilibacillus oryzae]|uniref:Uncharacterized protein n=1 Tax=Gracilibacillus oryzae TaxID=1672701 RepID=A0A7C8GXA7_9BACI|nr:hypothetical protein [Gracilibacillus oryzae]KAB8139471.1 hypothetical protein F9U64_00100 [Gracilibacillus oryzae]
MGKRKQNDNWAEAKKKCRLNQADIQMAKELGMTPKSLLKNIPAPNQQWKAPVKVWVRELYEVKFGRIIESNTEQRSKKHKAANRYAREIEADHPIDLEDLPF